ncbi:hypothetical protein ABK040_014865 [Willaertia magna]
MVKTTTRDIDSYDKTHAPPTQTWHPTTKRELKREKQQKGITDKVAETIDSTVESIPIIGTYYHNQKSEFLEESLKEQRMKDQMEGYAGVGLEGTALKNIIDSTDY